METLKQIFHVLTDVEGMIRWGGYFALAAIVFTETGLMVGFFLPGDSLLVTAGLFAAKGLLNIVWLNVLLITMAILGDATGYYIGRKLGPALFKKESSRLFKREHLIKTQLFYEKHGGKTIVIARFVPIIRTFAPVVAGIAQMSYRRFAMFNIFGGIGWVFSMTMIGYLLGKTVPNIDKYIEVIILLVVFLSILPGIIQGWSSRKKRQAGEIAFTNRIKDLIVRVRDAHWPGSADEVRARLTELDLPRDRKMTLEAGKSPAVEFVADASAAPSTMSEALYQQTTWDYEAKFAHAVSAATEVLGEPETRSTLSSSDLDTPDAGATWKTPASRISIHYRASHRDSPFQITIAIHPD